MQNCKGFSLIEIMIVVAIVGLLASIAIPSFVKARRKSQRISCIRNLREIYLAKERIAIDIPGVTVVTTTDMASYIKGSNPRCPACDLVYVLNPIDVDPQCQSGIPGHVFQGSESD